MNDIEARYLNIRRSTLVGALADLFLGIIKIVFGAIGHSQALITDGFHSLSDLLTDFMVIIAAKWGKQKPDFEHPYGHGRIETLGTLLMALIIILAGIGFGYDALMDLFKPHTIQKTTLSVLLVAIISVMSKEWLYRYTLKATEAMTFDLAHSSAWHHRSDALTSLVVLIGIMGNLLGFPKADPMAAILVSLFITKIGIQMIWNSLRELIDTGVDANTLKKIQQTIQETPGVLSVHLLRTRLMGNRIFVDVHVLVAPMISVSEGHYIGDQVTLNLKSTITQIWDVIVHIDPENDEIDSPSSDRLLNRDIIEHQIKRLTEKLLAFEQIEKIDLHYLEDTLTIYLLISIELEKYHATSIRQLSKQYEDILLTLPYVHKVNIYIKAL